MTDEEIAKLAEEIVKQKGGFYVEPETHYQQHQRLDQLLGIYDAAANIFVKAFLTLVIAGVLFLAALGFEDAK